MKKTALTSAYVTTPPTIGHSAGVDRRRDSANSAPRKTSAEANPCAAWLHRVWNGVRVMVPSAAVCVLQGS